MHLRIKVIQGKPQGHCLTFHNGEVLFGRGPECDVRPNSDLISRQHCLLKITDDSAKVRDLGSRNGTLVNGQLLRTERQLAHGDKLHLGSFVLQIFMEPELGPEALAKAG